MRIRNIVLILGALLMGSAQGFGAQVRTFHDPINVYVWDDGQWQLVTLDPPVRAEVEKVSNQQDFILWRIVSLPDEDRRISSRLTIREWKKDSPELRFYPWVTMRGNPYQVPEDQAVETALTSHLRDYISVHELNQALARFKNSNQDTVYVERNSVVYDVGVFGEGVVKENVIPVWSNVILDDGAVKNNPPPFRVIRTSYEYTIPVGDTLYVYDNGFVDHYIGEVENPGCNNVFIHRAELADVRIMPHQFGYVGRGPVFYGFSGQPGLPEGLGGSRDPSYRVEASSGLSVSGSRGVFYGSARGIFFPWIHSFGIAGLVSQYQVPPMLDPSAHGYGPFDRRISRMSVGSGPYIELGPFSSYTTFGRQRFEGGWVKGWFWQEETTFRFFGLGGLNPSIEFLINHVPESEYLYLRNREKVDIKRWSWGVLRLGAETLLQGDQTFIRSFDEAEFYYSQGAGLVELCLPHNGWINDGLSFGALVGYSSFGWVYGLEMSWMLHEAWRAHPTR